MIRPSIRVLLVVLCLATACQPRGTTESRESDLRSTTAPHADVVEFASPEKGVRLSYPAGWQPVDIAEEGFILWLVPAGSRATRDMPAVSLDVPRLPLHIPGLIPLGSVVRGYVDDLKKQHPGVKVDDPATLKVAGANARRVSATWNEGGASRAEEAVLTVHGDRVYIFRGTGPTDEMDKVRKVLEQVVNSVVWG